MHEAEVQAAYSRVAAARPKSETITALGRLHGILLDSWRFDFLVNAGNLISRNLAESVTDQQAREMALLFDKPAEATFQVTSIVTPGGESAPSYELVALRLIES